MRSRTTYVRHTRARRFLRRAWRSRWPRRSGRPLISHRLLPLLGLLGLPGRRLSMRWRRAPAPWRRWGPVRTSLLLRYHDDYRLPRPLYSRWAAGLGSRRASMNESARHSFSRSRVEASLRLRSRGTQSGAGITDGASGTSRNAGASTYETPSGCSSSLSARRSACSFQPSSSHGGSWSWRFTATLALGYGMYGSKIVRTSKLSL